MLFLKILLLQKVDRAFSGSTDITASGFRVKIAKKEEAQLLFRRSCRGRCVGTEPVIAHCPAASRLRDTLSLLCGLEDLERAHERVVH